MTNGGSGAPVDLLRRAYGLQGVVALVGLLALIVGFFIGSAVGFAVCVLVAMAAGVYLFLMWRQDHHADSSAQEGGGDAADSESSDTTMKKLLFDDFQTTGSKYVVKEVDEEARVVPSARTATPVPIPVKPETVRELEIPDFFDLDSDTAYAEVEPKSEFHSLLNKVLLVLKEVLFAHSVAFFWANREKGQMVLESMATDSKVFMEAKRFDLGEDLVSQIATTGKPQLLGRMHPGADTELLRYYSGASGVHSVIAVPVFFMNGMKDIRPVGVIVADSTAEDAFGDETLTLLTRFTKLVSSLVKSYTDKYDLLLDSEVLSSLRKMYDRVSSDPNEQTLFQSLMEEANRLASWDFASVVMYADEHCGWVVQRITNKTGQPYVAAEQVVDMQQSVIGESIRSNCIKVVDDLAAANVIRFAPDENLERRGSFLCIPISSFNRCYGTFAVESRTPVNFSGGETESLYRLVEHAAAMLEVLYMNDLVREHVIIDQLTQSLTRKYFLKKMEEEVKRAEDFNEELSCVALAVDNYDEHVQRYGRDGADAILNEVAKVVRASLRSYDTLGRHEDARLGVMLVNTTANEAYLWAEKVRKTIAGHVINVAGKSLSVTISAGVCGLSEGMDSDMMLAGMGQVLEKALQHGGNVVRVY